MADPPRGKTVVGARGLAALVSLGAALVPIAAHAGFAAADAGLFRGLIQQGTPMATERFVVNQERQDLAAIAQVVTFAIAMLAWAVMRRRVAESGPVLGGAWWSATLAGVVLMVAGKALTSRGIDVVSLRMVRGGEAIVIAGLFALGFAVVFAATKVVAFGR